MKKEHMLRLGERVWSQSEAMRIGLKNAALPTPVSRRYLLVHFGFVADACSITRQDNGVPFFKAMAARSALVSLRSLHKECASSCRIARSSKSSMVICHIALSSAP